MRIGLFGGTFDPPHVGHVLVASDACESLALDRVVFIPNARQPLKSDSRQTQADERLAMTRLAVAGDARFTVDAGEVTRGGVSFTVETLEAYAQSSPGDERYFLVGADVRATFAHWRAPDRIAALAHIAILRRAGDGDSEPPAADAADEVRRVAGPSGLEPVVVTTRRIDVSSTEIRDRVRRGQSIRGYVCEAVEQFVHAHGLYR